MNSRNSSTSLLRRTSRWCKAAILGAAFAWAGTAGATVTVTLPGNVGPTALNASYATLALAISDLNTKTTISGPVTIALDPGFPETAPAGGYVISATLAGASNTNRVTIAGGGNTVTAFGPQTVGFVNDGVIKIQGSDFITISGFTLTENAANIINTPSGSNTMTELGIAVLYATNLNGCQGITITGNTIDMNRTYTSTYGIYSNSSHSPTAFTTPNTATGAAGANHDLTITANNITDVNQGIVVVGPTAAADQQTGLVIGGSAPNANTITNFGTGAALSTPNLVSGTMNGVLVRNCKGYTISNNNITSSTGGVTTGTLRGIFHNANSNAPTGAFTNNINNNTIALQSGAATGAVNGILVEGTTGNATSTLNINTNNFTQLNHSVASSGSIIGISNATNILSTNFNSNTFTNIATNTTGSFTFFVYGPSLISGASFSLSSNLIVTGFTRTGVGSTTVWTSGASSVNGSSHTMNSNNFSNITLTGGSSFTGLNNNDGASASSGPVKSMNGNTFNNITTGAGTVTPMFAAFSGPGTTVNTNTITNITTGSSITALSIGGSNQATITVQGNTISGINSAGTTVTGLAIGAFTASVSKNKICDLNGSVAGSIVTGLSLTSSTTNTVVTASNNIIGNLTAPIATGSNAIRGIDLTGVATTSAFNLFYNTVYLNNTLSGVGFGSSAIQVATSTTATTSALDMRDNILVNTSVQNGAGLTVAYRRTSGIASTLANYAAASNNNLFYAGTPGASNLIYADGTSTAQTLAQYKAGVFTAGTVAPRDAASVTENPPFLSTLCGNANFLHMNTAIATGAESGGATVSITDDFDGDARGGTPDIGADEFAGTPLALCMGTPATSTITGVAAVCSGLGTTLSLSVLYTDLLITYQWRSSTTPSGPYLTTLGTSATQATGPLAVPTYYICEVTCSNGPPTTMTTLEKSVLINALPTVTVNGVAAATGSYCTPSGSPVVLTAGGAVTYAWSPTAGLTPTSGSPVSAAPASTTTYTVTGTDGNGCVGTATAAITVAATPQGVTATATPATICFNGTSNLTSTAAAQNPASLPNSYAFAGSTGTYNAISGTVLPNGVGDDDGNGNLAIGFTFRYNGTDHTIFSAGSNGLMILGDATPSYIVGVPSSYPFSNALATTVNRIAPLWDDNNTTGGSIQFSTTGSVGSRILTVQWTGMHTGSVGSASNPTIDVQVKLYEATGAVQFVYGSTSAALVGTTASIGISGASGNFVSVTPLSPANTSTSSTAVENTGIASATNFPTGTTYTFTPPQLPLTFAWTAPGNLVSPGTQNTATNALASSETFTITVTNSGCPATATAAVTTSAPITAATITGTLSYCAGGSTTLTAVPTDGGGPFTYAWTGPGGPAGTLVTQVANAPGIWSVIVSDACAGTAPSVGVTVVENALPTVAISPNPANGSNCSGAGNVLTATGALTYTWSPTLGLTPTSGSPVTANPANTTTYTVTGTDVNGCQNTDTQVINVGENPTMGEVTSDQEPVCEGGSTNLNASATLPFPGYTGAVGTYALEPCSANAGPDGDDEVSASPEPIGFSFNYYGVEFTDFGISTNGNIQLGTGAYSNQFTDAAIPNAAVPNNMIALAWDDWFPAPGEITYELSGLPGSQKLAVCFTTSGRGSGAADNIDGQIVLEEGTNNIVLTVTNKNVSVNTSTQGIENAGGNAGSLSVPGRNNSAWSTTNNTYVFSPNPTSIAYSWLPLTNTLLYANTTVPIASVVTATETYTVTATSAIGCTATGTVTVTMVPAADAGSDGSIAYCSTDGASDLFDELGGTPDNTGTWSPALGGGNLGTYDPATDAPGVYTYTVLGTTPCPNETADVTVTEQAAPDAGSNDVLVICVNAANANLFLELGGTPQGGGSWTDPSNVAHSGTFDPGVDVAGVYTYTVNAIAPCVGSDVATVTVSYDNTDTDGDAVIDCIDDCDNFPGVIGGPCDMNANPNIFTLGEVTPGCTCALAPCTNDVTVELATDPLNSSEASWEILDQLTNLVICQASILFDNNANFTEFCCLPDGCYRLRVTDSGGDGFVSGGVTGGYQLRERYGAQRRIIDNFLNFSDLAGGPPDVSAIIENNTPSSIQYSDNGSFCLPIGDVKPKFDHCDKLDFVNYGYIVCNRDNAVFTAYSPTATTTGYEFWFYNPNGGYSYRRFRSHATSDGNTVTPIGDRACHFKINRYVPAPPGNQNLNVEIPYNTLLNVRVRPRLNGLNGSFGPACFFKIDPTRAACPLVKLQDNPANVADFSCGVTRNFGGPNSALNRIVATPPQFSPTPLGGGPGPLRYQFRFRVTGELDENYGCIVRPIQLSPTLTLNWTSGQKLACGVTYQVDVRVSKDGGATWCVGGANNNVNDCGNVVTPWGKICSVTISNVAGCYIIPPPFAPESNNLAPQGTEGGLTMYPNPNRGDQVFINLSGVASDVNLVSVDIYDLSGKKVMTRAIPLQDGNLNTAMELNGDLSGGMYLVNITAGTKVYTERLVIQP